MTVSSLRNVLSVIFALFLLGACTQNSPVDSASEQNLPTQTEILYLIEKHYIRAGRGELFKYINRNFSKEIRSCGNDFLVAFSPRASVGFDGEFTLLVIMPEKKVLDVFEPPSQCEIYSQRSEEHV